MIFGTYIVYESGDDHDLIIVRPPIHLKKRRKKQCKEIILNSLPDPDQLVT
jgi:hypothetical protein